MHRFFRKEKGFTLVELAVSLVIIGLIITGILKGKKMLINSKVTATVAQIKDLEAAVTNFKDLYSYLPGDLPTTATAIKGCGGVASLNKYCTVANGDGSIGESDWDMTSYQPLASDAVATCNQNIAATSNECVQGNETLLFWFSLQQSGLISGVTTEISGDTTPATVEHAFGKTLPVARTSGGFWVGNSQNGSAGRDPRVGSYTLFGPILTMVKFPTSSINFSDKGGVVTPGVAAIMDRKIDDGLPASGTVQAYGYDVASNTSCYGTDDHYVESSMDIDCGIHVRIQK